MSRTLKWDGDLVRSSNNQGYDMVTGLAKCRQDVGMVLSTDIRPSTGDGSGLDEVLGQDTLGDLEAYAMNPVMFDFQTRVRVGLSNLISSQYQYGYADRTRDELIHTFTPATIMSSSGDLRDFTWYVQITTEDGKSFPVSGSTGG